MSGRTPVPGSVRRLPSGARYAGRPDRDRRIEVTVVVRRRADPRSVAQRLDQAATSIGPAIRREEFAAAFGADPADLKRVADFGAGHGLQVAATDPDRRVVVLGGPIARVEAAFGVDLGLYQEPRQDSLFRGHEGPVQVPAELAGVVEGVYGLDDRPHTRPHARLAGRAEPGGAAGRLHARDVARLYEFPLNLDGEGQCIALLEFGGGYNPGDLRTYCATIGVPVPSVVDVSVSGGRNAPEGDRGSLFDREVALDLQVALAVAPRAAFVVYFAPNTDQGFVNALLAAVHDSAHRPAVVSVSWGAAETGWTEQARQGLDQALVDAALLGITVCCSSGDLGSTAGEADRRQHVEFPASSPHALGCGGTSLRTEGSGITGELAWSDEQGGTGGGVSDVFALPDWQKQAGVPVSANPGGRTGRGVPDVAANADSGLAYHIVCSGEWECVGGTSAVAPLFAGLVALASQRLGKTVGWLNPLLYRHCGGTFRDVVAGSNGAYRAGPGWDPCTGLGSPRGEALLGILATLVPDGPRTVPGT